MEQAEAPHQSGGLKLTKVAGKSQRGGSKPGERRGGRKAGTPNKTTALLKDAVLEAARLAGGKEGLTGYLKAQAVLSPNAFMGLLGKVLPMQIEGTGKDGAITVQINKMIFDDDDAPTA